MTRHFEFVAGNSANFWEVSQDGASVTVQFSRLGAVGQTQSKQLPSPEAAQRHIDKLVGQKLAKGYVERVAA
jgi:predicted DNA-binding WGR domain protein